MANLGGGRIQDGDMAPLVAHGDLERNASTGRGFRENERELLADKAWNFVAHLALGL